MFANMDRSLQKFHVPQLEHGQFHAALFMLANMNFWFANNPAACNVACPVCVPVASVHSTVPSQRTSVPFAHESTGGSITTMRTYSRSTTPSSAGLTIGTSHKRSQAPRST